MKKGQGSLEYLLILAAILAIAVVVVVVAQSMLAPGKTAGEVTGDKYKCGLAGIELVGYDKTNDEEFSVNYAGEPLSCTSGLGDLKDYEASCEITGGTIQVTKDACKLKTGEDV